MMAIIRRFGPVAAFLLVGMYAVIALRGPNGVSALMEKRKEIQQLENQNATLALENRRKRDRIERLKHNPTEQEMEIRKQLKLLRPGETSFILPEPADKPQPPPAAASPAQ